MARERTQAPWSRPSFIPAEWDWTRLLAKDGDALEALRGVELVDGVARLCEMNLLLHGNGLTAGSEAEPAVKVDDSLRGDPGDRYDVNPHQPALRQ
jgi:hypothetical protein